MNPEIALINDQNFEIPSSLEEIVNTILLSVGHANNISLSISFVNNSEMIILNEKYYGYAQSTDVLSFEANEIDPETGRLILGDIVICYPHVQNQSSILNNNLFDELKLMVIHGLLHLLGYDHDDEIKKSKMWQLQDKILKMNKIQLNQLPE
ncbi:MAG: rRNA maturation RNase YbeY [Anaerolineaceae bacterium]|nr:rRNA maturation RNase YbeY [Anaerolineaceae bacterium]